MTTDNEERLFEIRKRLEEYRKHKNDPYVYYPEEISEVRELKSHAAEDIGFLLVLLDQKLEEEFQNLLHIYLSDNPDGEEKLAREADVSRPTVRRWKNGKTRPSRVAAKIAIGALKKLLKD